jgi:AraC family transcriptional regulator
MLERRAFQGHSDREMDFRVLRSSAGRSWEGFDAFLYETSAGISEQQFVRYNVSMQVGRPLFVTSRCDGQTLRRLQVPGDVKIVPPRIPRVWETEAPAVKLSMYLNAPLMFSAAAAMQLDLDRIAISPQLHVRDPRIEYIGWAVKAELEDPAPFGRLYGEALGLALATHLLRSYAPAYSTVTDGRLSQRRLTRVLDYVRVNLDRDLSLSELATVAGVSPSHFKTLFRKSVGVPVHQYVVRRRVEHAAELLRQKNTPLADVALQAGFANQSHMARWTRRILGVSPAELRDA